jgi:hypothetical protein
MPTEPPTLGLGHLQFEPLLTTARLSANRNDFTLIAMLGLLGLRIFGACGANIADLSEEHGHRVRKVRGKGGKTVLIPLPPAVARAIDHATERREQGPILRNRLGRRMDRHAATRRLQQLSATAVGPPPNVGVMFIREQGEVFNHRTNLVTRDDPLEVGVERVSVRGAPGLFQDLDHLMAAAFKQVLCLGPSLGRCVLQNRARGDRRTLQRRPFLDLPHPGFTGECRLGGCSRRA